MSGSVFSETLQQITDTKLDELSKKRATFEEDKASTLSSIESQSDPIERLVLLSNGVKKSFGIKLDNNAKVTTGLTRHPRLEVQLKNLDRFLAQARQDPSVSTKTLSDWEKDLLRHLEVQSLKYQYASLYGQLVTEWLSGDQKSTADKTEDTEMGDTFEDVGSSAKLKSKQEWESKVFEPAHVDVGRLNNYLETVFGLSYWVKGEDRKKKLQAVAKLREAVQAFEVDISRPDQLDRYSLTWAIRGLMASDLLTNEKREVLKDFLGNPVILSEISDVLNLRLAALGSWKWGPDGVPVEQRRKISGIFSVQMHEDLLQSIFLQYIGVKWSVFFRRAFVSFRKADGAWNSLYKDIPEPDKKRLEYYLGRVPRRRSLQKERQKIHSSDYFVAKLLKRVDEVTETADGEVEAECEEFTAQRSVKRRKGLGAGGAMRMRRIPAAASFEEAYSASSPVPDGPESDVDEDDEPNSPDPRKTLMQLKQQIVHLVSTEAAINTRLHDELTVFHAVFEDWESLLPHETICTVLRFLGVSQHWLGFFEQYLQAPLRFLDEDQAPPRVRRRGVPSSHALSDVLGETVLFCLDLAVNQAASGQPLWRYGDDLWFWSPDHNTAVAAWKAIERFTEATGTAINERKTGTVCIPKNKDSQLSNDKSLPEGDIRWGFLFLSPQTGRFEIDHKMVDAHIDELRKQLNDKSSIFSFIQTWNAFAAKFFSSNFGKSANCFGRAHVDDMLATHRRIQQQIFSSGAGLSGMGTSSSIIEHLRKTIQQRFGIADVPDGYFYFPVALGGLDLQSPFIPLLQIRDSVLESHDKLFEDMFETEKEAYDRFKGQFDRGNVHRRRNGGAQGPWQPELKQDRDNFFDAAEFVSHREDLGVIPDEYSPQDLLWVFQQLMAQPTEQHIDQVDELEMALKEVPAGGQAIQPQWHAMDASWRWITAMYGPEIIERFGGLSIVDPGLLPMGMVGLLREKRVTWQG